jgi:hypothetical protein
MTYLKVAKERVDEEVDDDEWRKEGVEHTHKDETSLQAVC